MVYGVLVVVVLVCLVVVCRWNRIDCIMLLIRLCWIFCIWVLLLMVLVVL